MHNSKRKLAQGPQTWLNKYINLFKYIFIQIYNKFTVYNNKFNNNGIDKRFQLTTNK